MASLLPPPSSSTSPTTRLLKGKTALVTGATGSIGSACCRALSEFGCNIIVVDLNSKKCEDFANGLSVPAVGISIDVSKEEAVINGVDSAISKLNNMSTTVGAVVECKGIDILINVAGKLSNNKLVETSAEEWRSMHAVNYDSCFYLSKKCVPYMVEQQWGRVVNMSSWAWKSGGLTAGTAYSASKAAMVGLTFSLARQFAGDGVTINAIAPCYVLSPMVSEQLTEEKRNELLEKIPVKRFCLPEEVAHAVNFFVSPLSGFITGEVLDMNGGFQMD